MKMKRDKADIKFETDYGIVLECIREVYSLEEEHLRLGADFRKTMVFPFMKMLERHCSSIQMDKLHKVLWEVYQENREEKDFLEKAGVILKPYCGEK